ncbi:MAG: pilus assembly protein [Gammaproteobacteria bacterium]|nr:hypothetical protein [Gammaproteobacteria bacterium]MXY57742.1 pilus assembly protein [Gammaproteobacteria bacterium]MYF30391.1 pilus assembly protein [Gammaproteobacteria bacterium]MYK46767.1 pilus assembly protein [Gammaproteobacteria bacterium]
MDSGVAKHVTRRGLFRCTCTRTAQGGAVLFLGLALLLAITAGALSAAQTTSLELLMSRSSHDAALAFHAADAALAEAEAWLGAGGDATDPQVYPRGRPYGMVSAWRDQTAWTTYGQTAATPLRGVFEAPRFLIEWVTTYDTGIDAPTGTLVDVFRVTATGVGSRPATVVRLQSTLARTRGAPDAAVTRLSWVELEL